MRPNRVSTSSSPKDAVPPRFPVAAPILLDHSSMPANFPWAPHWKASEILCEKIAAS